jgi:peroxiredoxin
MPSLPGYRFVLAFVLLLCSTVAAQQNPHGQLPVTTAPQPFLFLIRDPVVHNDLRLNARQREAIQALSEELDPVMWSMRNKGPKHIEQKMREATSTARTRLSSILSRDQMGRLEQIERWVLGTKAFLGDDLPGRLQLAEEQREEIRLIISETQQAVQELGKQLQEGIARESLEKKASELHTDEQRRILAKLTPLQQQQWKELLGTRIDLESLGRVTFRAPALTAEPDWINSSPLASDRLRGKVVALHFYAFGCINCKRNFPWYKEWHEAFQDRGLVVLGIQTPETAQERVVEKVRNAARESGLEYPIVIDNERRNWNAWGNSMWPSTYLIDKQGRVRAWWYGELNWQGAGGQDLLRARIEELLAEDTGR